MKSHRFITKTVRTAFATSTLAALLLAGGIQNSAAVPLGPGFPPPGGVTFSSSGAGIGKAGGKTFNFSAFNLGASSNLYWGAASASAVGMALDGAINDLGTFTGNVKTEIVSLSLGSTGLAVGSGNTEIALNTGTFNINTNFRLTVRDLTNALVPLITTGSVGLGFAGALVDVNSLATNGFTARLEAFVGTTPLDVYFNNQSTVAGSSQTSFQGGFFHDPVVTPEPGTLALFGLALAGLGFARRKRVA